MSARNRLLSKALGWSRTAGVKSLIAAKILSASRPFRSRELVLLNTMPKSGSVYVAKSLQKILGLDFMYIGNRYALIDQIDVREARTFSRGGYVSQNHLAPSVENLQIIEHFKLKMVLHLRDPRQALLSLIHHLDRVSGCSDASDELLYFAPRTPKGYFEFSLGRKIDWQIENYLPHLVEWIERWAIIADERSSQILITHQDHLRSNEKAFFSAILAFYQINRDFALPDLPRTMEETHFRQADPTEWRRTFTREQTARATTQIPEALRTRFGWDEGIHARAVA